MGGCRCNFRKCTNTSAARPDMHFFHFPHKDVERCKAWIDQSGSPELILLPDAKMRNKVVCQDHFTPDCFMNYRQDRLTRKAVPTLTSKPRDSLSAYPANSSLPPVQPLPEHLRPPKKIKVYANPLKRPATTRTPPRIINRTMKLGRLQDKVNATISVIPPEEIKPEEPETISDLPEAIEENTFDSISDQQNVITSVNNKLESIVQLLQESLKRPTGQSRAPETSRPTNKKKLFNSMRKHLNPLMATLLGISLFASADHEWSMDEKELIIELYSQGETVYKYFRDEFRLQLPAIAEVQRWRRQQGDDED